MYRYSIAIQDGKLSYIDFNIMSITMSEGSEFVVIGCPKCRRILVANRQYLTKTCQCGYKIDLHKVKYLVTCSSGTEAVRAVQELQKRRNTGFTSARDIMQK